MVTVKYHESQESASLEAYETLQSLRAGESATIVGVSGPGAAAKRLADMGFVSGARIEMIRSGNPCLVRIGGTFVGLGRDNQGRMFIAGRGHSDVEAPVAVDGTGGNGSPSLNQAGNFITGSPAGA